ncbi:MAG: hypothetical protein ACRD20_20365, partial [Terriglobales bacterium]
PTQAKTRLEWATCFSFALSGLGSVVTFTPGLRPGLHSWAASRLGVGFAMARGWPSQFASMPDLLVRESFGFAG